MDTPRNQFFRSSVNKPQLALWAGLLLLLAMNSAHAFDAQNHVIENAIRHAAPPPNKVRTAGHEWLWELEQAGVFSRARPRKYRLAIPLIQLYEGGPNLMATYASPPGTDDGKKLMLFVHIPLD
jgi:hypothetical protein